MYGRWNAIIVTMAVVKSLCRFLDVIQIMLENVEDVNL